MEVITGLVVAAVGVIGIRIAWQQFGPDFRQRYGEGGPLMLFLFLFSFPTMVLAHLLVGRRRGQGDDSEP